MMSYAPVPSTDTTVFAGLASVAAVRAWTTASVPVRVDRANWCSAQLVWMGPANICARFRETSRRRTSAMTIFSGSSIGFFSNATIRPSPRQGMIVAGSLVCANRWATAVRRWVVFSIIKHQRSVSAVRPERPGAAFLFFLLERLKLWMMVAAESSTGCCGRDRILRSQAGRVSQFAQCAGGPGAGVPAFTACRAADNSPMCTR